MDKVMIFLMLAFGANRSFASNYPPDYPLHSDLADLQKQNEVVAFTRTIGYHFSSLIVYYRGHLVEEACTNQNVPDQLKVWVKLNGQEIVMPMMIPGCRLDSEQWAIAKVSDGPYDCYSVGGQWDCLQPSTKMKEFFKFSKPHQLFYAVNAWDLEAAFTIEGTDLWDNNGGMGINYRYYFPEYR